MRCNIQIIIMPCCQLSAVPYILAQISNASSHSSLDRLDLRHKFAKCDWHPTLSQAQSEMWCCVLDSLEWTFSCSERRTLVRVHDAYLCHDEQWHACQACSVDLAWMLSVLLPYESPRHYSVNGISHALVTIALPAINVCHVWLHCSLYPRVLASIKCHCSWKLPCHELEPLHVWYMDHSEETIGIAPMLVLNSNVWWFFVQFEVFSFFCMCHCVSHMQVMQQLPQLPI